MLPRPAISWKALTGTGIFLFGGQFVLLFYAMEAGLPPGLSSVLVQLQGPLTLVLAALFLGERATKGQWAGLFVAMVGVILIARSVEGTASLFAVASRSVGAELGGRQSLPARDAGRLGAVGHGVGQPDTRRCS